MKRLFIYFMAWFIAISPLLPSLTLAATSQAYCADLTGTWDAPFQDAGVKGQDQYTLTQHNGTNPPTLSGVVNYYCVTSQQTVPGVITSGSVYEGNGQWYIEINADNCAGNGIYYNMTVQIPLGNTGCADAVPNLSSPPNQYTDFFRATCLVPLGVQNTKLVSWPANTGIAEFSTQITSGISGFNWSGRKITGHNTNQNNSYIAQCPNVPNTPIWSIQTPFSNLGYSGVDYLSDSDFSNGEIINDAIGWTGGATIINDIREQGELKHGGSTPCGVSVQEQLFIDCPSGNYNFDTINNYYEVENGIVSGNGAYVDLTWADLHEQQVLGSAQSLPFDIVGGILFASTVSYVGAVYIRYWGLTH